MNDTAFNCFFAHPIFLGGVVAYLSITSKIKFLRKKQQAPGLYPGTIDSIFPFSIIKLNRWMMGKNYERKKD
jgi:hypothetical protein